MHSVPKTDVKMQPTYLTDHFLIAMPTLGNPNFYRTVTYICQHNEEGALGFVINRPTHLHVAEILEQIDIDGTDTATQQLPVYYGGPVSGDRGFVLHSPEEQWVSTLVVSTDLALTTSRDILEAMANGQGPERVLVALGYAGWGKGQLEREILENSWLSCKANPDILFNTPPEERWKAAAELIGVDINLLSSQAGHG